MFEHYLELSLNLIVSPVGLLGLVGTLAWLSLTSRSPRVAIWTIAFPLLISTFGRFRYIEAPYTPPLNYMEIYSRPLFAALLILVILSIVANRRLAAGFQPKPVLIAFLCFQLYFAALLVIYKVPGQQLAVLVFLLSFSAMVMVENVVRRYNAQRYFVEGIVLGGALFTAACLFQWVTAPQNSVWAGRFIGITSNSQQTAQYLALFIVPTVFLILASRGSQIRWGLWLCVALQVGLLLYTGSRTGMLMTSLGFAILLRRKSRRIVYAVAGIGCVFALLALIVPDQQRSTERMLTLEDTRSVVYAEMWHRFMANPVTGKLIILDDPNSETARVAIQENSYLVIASMMGVIGIAIFSAFLVPLLLTMWKIWKMPVQTSEPGFPDFVLASLVSILAGAFFEGYLLAIVGPCYLLLYVYVAMAETIANPVAVYQPQHAPNLPPRRMHHRAVSRRRGTH